MAVLPRHACRFRMNDDPGLNAALFDGATRALTLTIDHMMMIGRSSAEERLAWFLTMLAARSACPSAHVLDLAMQRQDIADYLGLTIETVSRTFTLFRDRGLVSLPHKRRVLILRSDLLARLAAADRDAAPIGFEPRIRSWRLRSPDMSRDGCANGRLVHLSVWVQPYLQEFKFRRSEPMRAYEKDCDRWSRRPNSRRRETPAFPAILRVAIWLRVRVRPTAAVDIRRSEEWTACEPPCFRGPSSGPASAIAIRRLRRRSPVSKPRRHHADQKRPIASCLGDVKCRR